jgi:hypothetical protein
MASNLCKNCKHFALAALECRAHAPKPVLMIIGVVPAPADAPADWVGGYRVLTNQVSIFPPTRPDHWCSEFVPAIIH